MTTKRRIQRQVPERTASGMVLLQRAAAARVLAPFRAWERETMQMLATRILQLAAADEAYSLGAMRGSFRPAELRTDFL